MLREERPQRLLARRQINPHLRMTSRDLRSMHVMTHAGLRWFLWRRTDRMLSWTFLKQTGQTTNGRLSASSMWLEPFITHRA